MLDLASLNVHPIAETYPLLCDAELDELGESIATRGLKYKILRWRGRIVDGRNRIAACKRKGIELTEDDFRDIDCAEDELEAEIKAYNECRRHLSMEFLKARREKRLPRVAALRDQGLTIVEIADSQGVSRETVRKDIAKINESQLHDPIRPATLPEKTTVVSPAETNGHPKTTVVERQPGDDSDEIAREEAQARARPRNGSESYRWRDFEAAVGGVLREIDKVGNAFEVRDSPDADAFRKRLKSFCADFHDWFKELKDQKGN